MTEEGADARQDRLRENLPKSILVLEIANKGLSDKALGGLGGREMGFARDEPRGQRKVVLSRRESGTNRLMRFLSAQRGRLAGVGQGDLQVGQGRPRQ